MLNSTFCSRVQTCEPEREAIAEFNGRSSVWTGDRNLAQSAHFLRDFWRTITTTRLFFLAWVVVFGAFGLTYATTVKGEFVSTVAIVLEPRRIANDGPEDLRHYHQMALDSQQVDTELQVLRSERLLRRAFNQLDLVKTSELANGHDGLWSLLAHELHRFAPNASPYEADARAYYAFASRVRCLRVNDSYEIEVTYRSHNAALSARVANAVLAAYIGDRLERRSAQIQRVGGAYLVARETQIEAQISAVRTSIAEGSPLINEGGFGDVRITDVATAPLAKSYPKTVPILMFALGLGVITWLALIGLWRATRIEPASSSLGVTPSAGSKNRRS